MNKLIAITVLILTSATGCAVRMTGPVGRPVPPVSRPAPPPPVAHRMSYDEAVRRAIDYARSRGFHEAHVRKAQLTGNDVWKVKLDVERSDAYGKLDVDLDARSRGIIRAQEHVKYDKPQKQKKNQKDVHGARALASGPRVH